MSKKQIEPTNSMVGGVELGHKLMQMDVRAILRAGLNHPDAAGLFADVDDRPWEPLNEDDTVRVGDEVRQDHLGVTITAVVGRVDRDGDPRTDEDRFIGGLNLGTWCVRRAVQELPEEDGAVIVRKGERIEARHAGKTWVATEAVLVDGEWRGTWFEKGRATGDWNVMWAMSPDRIIPDTCQVADQ